MHTRDEEVLIATRLPALVPLAIALAVIAGGLFITGEHLAHQKPLLFIIAWCCLWGSIGFGVLIYGLIRLIKPPVIARFTEDSVHFPFAALGPISWKDFITARKGLAVVRKITTPAGNGGTRFYWRAPIIITVRDPKLLHSKRWLGKFTHEGHGLGDGTTEILLKTVGCPISNDALITKLSAAVGAAPDLRPADPNAATLGGVSMNQKR